MQGAGPARRAEEESVAWRGRSCLVAGSALTRRAALTFTAVLPGRRVLGKPCIVPALPYQALSRRAESFPAAPRPHEPRYYQRTQATSRTRPATTIHIPLPLTLSAPISPSAPGRLRPSAQAVSSSPCQPPPFRPFLPRRLLQHGISATVVILPFSSSFCLPDAPPKLVNAPCKTQLIGAHAAGHRALL